MRSIFFWLLICLTCVVYLATLLLVLWIPCQGELLIGFCNLGKIFIAAIGVMLLSAYLFLVFLDKRRRSSRPQSSNSGPDIVLPIVLTLVFLIMPLGYLFGPIRRDHNLQPYSLAANRQNGVEEIEFLTFSDNPVEGSQSGKLQGFLATGDLQVAKSGIYTIQPIRPKGDVPIFVMTGNQSHLATEESIYLNAGEVYQFDYFTEIQPNENSTDCEMVSWKILWQVESIPPFPLYLFGQGAFAQVYPDDTGEYAFVTHINPDFQTDYYEICSKGNQ